MLRTLTFLTLLTVAPLLASLEVKARDLTFTVTDVAGPFAFPWSVAWLPDGTMLLTERDGRLLVLTPAGPKIVGGVPPVAGGGQGGLFDVLVLPAESDRQELLLSYAFAAEGGRSLRVSRAVLSHNGATWSLGALRTVFDLLPRSGGTIQYGGRLALLPDNTLLIATGDRGVMARAQDPADGAGKIHRVRLDGTIPDDNPFIGKVGYLPSLWTLGHRNIQGLWVQPGGTGAATAEVWATEHGPQGGDELNRIVPGRNYGWPVITYGVNYGTGTKIGEGVEKLGLEQPIFFWKPSIAPSGLTRLVDSRFGSWRGSFLGGALAGQGLSRFVLGEGVAQPPDRATIPAHPTGRLVEEEYLLANVLGRIRDVRTGPDGLVYLTIDSAQGHLYRLEPRGN